MNRLTHFKKGLALLLALFMVLSLAACQPTTTEAPAAPVDESVDALFQAGTYTATVDGHNGDLTVEVTVTADEIVSIETTDHKESAGITDLVFERIPAAILSQQNLAVDAVSGATVTSDALISAIINALEQAGADIAALQSGAGSAAATGEAVSYDADVVVIGGGGAGLAAAVTAHQNGASVIIIEKMPRLGGNTILSGGAFNAVDPGRQEAQGIEDSIDKHFQQTFDGGDQVGNPELVRVLVENAYPAIEWLESLGMKFNDEVFTVLGGLWPRAHKPSTPLGTGFIDTYSNYINAHDGIEVLLDTEATELIVENGRVTGVIAKHFNDDVTLNASKGVVMASGGFGVNSEMRDRFNEDWPALTNLKSTNHPGATGDGLVMAEAIGASLIGMKDIQLLPLGDPNSGSLSGNIEQGVENRIFVNKEGNRFVDEGARRDVMTLALMEQTDSYLYVVLDSTNYPDPETQKNNFNETINELIDQGRAFKGDTLEELAAAINVDPASLVQAVESFNEAVEKGGPDEFGRTLFDRKIEQAPFYAGPRVPTVHHTMGGIEINTLAQVLDTDGNVIPGFYAAGEVTGGIHGANRLGGNALADIAVFGRIAGENVANEQ
ncbi:flavocytochrome c [Anoxynatronum sibiricum]|uniref:Urocanate reductase n=1 Tax=Anoxynatronum sibiricum TaxID=210623 RepID=A0ABU9VV03_9CLOT